MRAGTRPHHPPLRAGRPAPRPPRAAAAPSGAGIAPPATGKHFLHIDDWSRDELQAVLQTAVRVKKELKTGDGSYQPLKGKTMAMIFTKPSMRTRVSFETVWWEGEGGRRAGGWAGWRAVGRRRGDGPPTAALPPPLPGLFQARRARDLPGP